MRALIRARIIPGLDGKLPDRIEDRTAYDKVVISLFRDMGYDPRSLPNVKDLPDQTDLATSADVENLFADVPLNIEEEKNHLVMLAYTSEGQAKFIVCSINQYDLHIRIKDDLFEKLRRACAEICERSWENPKKFKDHPHLRIVKSVEIMEPGHGHATIRGDIVQNPLRTVIRENFTETVIAVFTFIFSLFFFFFAPKLALWITSVLNMIFDFNVLYIQSAIERTDTAFLVTFAVTAINLIMRWLQLRRTKPIKWNAQVEPTHVSK